MVWYKQEGKEQEIRDDARAGVLQQCCNSYKNFGFYLKCDGKALEGSAQGNDIYLIYVFKGSLWLFQEERMTKE